MAAWAHWLSEGASMGSPHERYLDLGINSGQRQRAWRDLIGEAPDIETLAKILH